MHHWTSQLPSTTAAYSSHVSVQLWSCLCWRSQIIESINRTKTQHSLLYCLSQSNFKIKDLLLCWKSTCCHASTLWPAACTALPRGVCSPLHSMNQSISLWNVAIVTVVFLCKVFTVCGSSQRLRGCRFQWVGWFWPPNVRYGKWKLVFSSFRNWLQESTSLPTPAFRTIPSGPTSSSGKPHSTVKSRVRSEPSIWTLQSRKWPSLQE